MSNLFDNVFDSGLSYLANYSTLYFLDTDIGLNSSLIASHTIASTNDIAGNVGDYPLGEGGRMYEFQPSEWEAGPIASSSGTITHFVYTDSSDNILVSGSLTTSITVDAGAKIRIPNSFAVIFEDPA